MMLIILKELHYNKTLAATLRVSRPGVQSA